MLRLKGCPKCGKGDQVLERDRWGRYWTCVQCGYSKELDGTASAVRREGRPPAPGAEHRRGLRAA